MYEELVKDLRIYANDGTDEIRSQAADAIEELSKPMVISVDHQLSKEEIERLRRDMADAPIVLIPKSENASIPRWIPVTERLPKTRESILGKKSSKVIVAFRFDDGTQGTDTAHTLNGEWVFEDHITVVARTVTHWIPLPEPQKEET